MTPAEVEANVAAATTSFADIDGSGNVDALTDGLMLLRYLFGLTGASLIDSAVAAGAERTTAAEIGIYPKSYALIGKLLGSYSRYRESTTNEKWPLFFIFPSIDKIY